ncbi:MAG TPA: hypothetical protein VEJ37_09400 [Xanthobacteraceae bacterium]|nr:hypothetical protein [Xanthobacteraceae bacterium]
MIKRGFAFAVALAALSTLCLFEFSPALADQAFQRFLPLLIDLDGWHGKKPDGLSMEMANNSMTTAARDYDRGTAKLHAGVIIGPAAAGALAPTRNAMNIETTDGHMITSTINGLPVTKTFNTKEKSGAILIALGPAAMLSFSYSGLSEDEALQLAQKFDWKAIQAAAQSK